MENLTVVIKNPPPDATLWDLALCDWNITTLMNFLGRGSGIAAYLDIAKEASFEVPEGVAFPLRIVRLTIDKWNADKTALIELYYIQSYHPYLWDFDKGQWSNIPDPTYREVFIPQLGSYYYNVATEQFEEMALPTPEFSGFIVTDYSAI